MQKGNQKLREIIVHERSSTASVEGRPKRFVASMAEYGSAKKPTDSEGTAVGGTKGTLGPSKGSEVTDKETQNKVIQRNLYVY